MAEEGHAATLYKGPAKEFGKCSFLVFKLIYTYVSCSLFIEAVKSFEKAIDIFTDMVNCFFDFAFICLFVCSFIHSFIH